MYETPMEPEGEFSDGIAIRFIWEAASIQACSCTLDVSGVEKVRSSMLAIDNGIDCSCSDDDDIVLVTSTSPLCWRWTKPSATLHCKRHKNSAVVAFIVVYGLFWVVGLILLPAVVRSLDSSGKVKSNRRER
jgi:hypothetical protein